MANSIWLRKAPAAPALALALALNEALALLLEAPREGSTSLGQLSCRLMLMMS